MNGLAQNNGLQPSPDIESQKSIPAQPGGATLVEAILPQLAATLVKPRLFTDYRSFQIKNYFKLTAATLMFTPLIMSFSGCMPSPEEIDTLRISSIAEALHKAMNALHDSKAKLSNLNPQSNPNDIYADLQNLKTILISELLTIFKIINKTIIDPKNELQTKYFERLNEKLQSLGVSSHMTQENLNDLANRDVLGNDPTILEQILHSSKWVK